MEADAGEPDVISVVTCLGKELGGAKWCKKSGSLRGGSREMDEKLRGVHVELSGEHVALYCGPYPS